jgi:hypothetical protein
MDDDGERRLPEIPRAMAYVAAVTLIVGAGLFLLTPFGVMPFRISSP